MTAPTAGPRPASVRRAPRPMSLWRLEVLRLVRSPRALVLGGVYLFFGLVSPVLARWMTEIMRYLSTTLTIVAPPRQAGDGMTEYVGQTSQTGLIVVVVVAAGALSLDARPGLATFYRTRTTGTARLLLPRYVVGALAAIAANALGAGACWYGTELLLGHLPTGAVLAGVACTSVYLAFAVAVVTLAAATTRTTLGAIGVGLVVLLVLPVLGLSGALHPWLPSTLVQAPVQLLATAGLDDVWRALAVSAVAVPALFGLAVRRSAARDL